MKTKWFKTKDYIAVKNQTALKRKNKFKNYIDYVKEKPECLDGGIWRIAGRKLTKMSLSMTKKERASIREFNEPLRFNDKR